MKRIYIDKMERDFNFELCKVNKTPICTIPVEYITRITRSLNDIDRVELSVPKTIVNSQMKTVINPVFEEIKDERLICVNGKDYFVIKTNTCDINENVKNITAYSREYKLGKIDIVVEDIAFMLIGKDEESGIYSLNEHMKEETGWTFGEIDDSVRYDIGENGEKVEKVRVQTTVNKRWLDYIETEICESYNCIATYDTCNKKINLYDIHTVGENIQIYLSNDNYIKSLSRVTSSEEIITRLHLIGGEEIDILEATATGYPYIEDYSYFRSEMSNELLQHLDKYYEMVDKRTVLWKELLDLKQEKNKLLMEKKTDLYIIYEEIRALKSIKEAYSSKNDIINESLIIAEISKKKDEQTVLEIEVKNLEEEVINLTNSILELNVLCKRETATDDDGNIIFTEDTLEELKEFIYSDTYTNDAFLSVEDLLNAGKRELSLRCTPTVNYDIGVKNFMERVINNNFRLQWNGQLGLSDIVILYDEDIDQEVFLYVVEYSQSPNNKEDGLTITLSNKKHKNKNIRTIADKLKEGGLAMKTLRRKSYILNNQKYNRINLLKEQIGGTI